MEYFSQNPFLDSTPLLFFKSEIYCGSYELHPWMQLMKKTVANINDTANYRLITNLNTNSKILEERAQRQIRHHIEGSPNFGSRQSAFHALHSTETAKAHVVSDLISSTNSGSPSILFSLDMHLTCSTRKRCSNGHGHSYAFPTPYWIGSYMSDRQQHISIDGVHSPSVKPTKGMPQ